MSSRRRVKENEQVKFGFAWYRRDQWQLLRQTASDLDVLEDTYDEWLHEAKQRLKDVRELGVDVAKVDLDVVEFNEWCRENGKPRNGDSRAQYAAHLLEEQDRMKER